MIISPIKYKKVKKVIDVFVRDAIYGCDECEKVIDFGEPDIEYLSATLHFKQDQAIQLAFCSWKCCFKYLPKVKCDYFVSLPFMSFDNTKAGTRAKDLLRLIKNIND